MKRGARAPRHFVVSCLLGVDGPLGAGIIIDPAIFTLDAAIPLNGVDDHAILEHQRAIGFLGIDLLVVDPHLILAIDADIGHGGAGLGEGGDPVARIGAGAGCRGRSIANTGSRVLSLGFVDIAAIKLAHLSAARALQLLLIAQIQTALRGRGGRAKSRLGIFRFGFVNVTALRLGDLGAAGSLQLLGIFGADGVGRGDPEQGQGDEQSSIPGHR